MTTSNDITNISIRIVDDVRGVLELLNEALTKNGFDNVIPAENGLKAIQILENKKIDLILSDLYMDPIDGMELLKYVRSFDKHKDIPFIMLSAENTRVKVAEAIKAGVDSYVLKPFSIVTLMDKIISVLVKKGYM